MKASELMAELKSRPQDARLLVLEAMASSPGNIVMMSIESVLGESKENKNIILIAKTLRPLDRFPSTLLRAKHNTYRASIQKSEKDGKYLISIDGVTVLSGFETEDQAKSSIRGFVLGFEMGKTEKGLDASKDPTPSPG